jgi:hypothetical protein
LEYFTDICDILWPIGTFCVRFVHFFLFWYHAPRKIWQPWFARNKQQQYTVKIFHPTNGSWHHLDVAHRNFKT